MTILESGINLMLYGMGTVFVFLTLLIVTTMMMSSVISKFFGVPESESAATQKPNLSLASGKIDPALLGVLQAAINEHKK